LNHPTSEGYNKVSCENVRGFDGKAHLLASTYVEGQVLPSWALADWLILMTHFHGIH